MRSKFPNISECRYISYDTETTGLSWWKDKVFGVSICTPDGEGYYFDIRKDEEALRFLRSEIPKCRKIVCHNAKFDWHMSREIGIIFPDDRIDDTMLRAALIDEHLLTYDLDSLGNKYIKIGKDTKIYEELSEIFGGKPTKSAQIPNLSRAPHNLVAKYAIQDATTTLKLWEWQEEEIDRQNIHNVCELERRLLPVLVDMERYGVRIDVDRTEIAIKEIDQQCETTQKKLNQLAGFDVNPNPSNSIKALFKPRFVDDRWVLIDGTVAPSTDKGGVSIDSTVLRTMKHPAAGLILKLRKMIKTRDTFLKGHILNHHNNGVVHANFNQTKSDNDLGTSTGRLSANNPALQQIHKRDVEIASIVRSLFLPDEHHVWVCNDWAQMDFRVFAHYVNDKRILEIYEKNPDTDFHKLASDLTGLPRSPRFTGDANAKQINLGLVFGMGQGRLAAEMGLPYTVEVSASGREYIKPGEEATRVFEKYHEAIPGVQDLLKNVASIARSRGYVKTIYGRRIRFPKGQHTHKAAGLIFQGSAADALKLKLIELHNYLKSTNSEARLLLNVHDEFDVSVPVDRDDIKKEISRIVTEFNDEIKFRVPIRTDQGVGENWWEASK